MFMNQFDSDFKIIFLDKKYFKIIIYIFDNVYVFKRIGRNFVGIKKISIYIWYMFCIKLGKCLVRVLNVKSCLFLVRGNAKTLELKHT